MAQFKKISGSAEGPEIVCCFPFYFLKDSISRYCLESSSLLLYLIQHTITLAAGDFRDQGDLQCVREQTRSHLVARNSEKVPLLASGVYKNRNDLLCQRVTLPAEEGTNKLIIITSLSKQRMMEIVEKFLLLSPEKRNIGNYLVNSRRFSN